MRLPITGCDKEGKVHSTNAMLANRVASALQRGQVVDSTIAYGLELRKSGIRLHMGCAFFSDSGNMTFEMSTLCSTTKTAAQVLHWAILNLR